MYFGNCIFDDDLAGTDYLRQELDNFENDEFGGRMILYLLKFNYLFALKQKKTSCLSPLETNIKSYFVLI